MKAVVDDKIPYIKDEIEKLVDEVVYLPGSKIAMRDVRDADILVVRTRTKCNRTLLEGSQVRLVVTATIGFDHLDTLYLEEAGIEWHNCPGCNATSVAQYVHNCLLLLEREKDLCLKDCTLGIVGVGHVGTQVLKACEPLVKRVLLNDPPQEELQKQARESQRQVEESQKQSHGSQKVVAPIFSGDRTDFPQKSERAYASLAALAAECDIITFHTPLVREGRYPSYHLADEAFLQGLLRKPVLINSGRGEVVDNEALLRALEDGRVREAIIDTWENEPNLSRVLLNKVYIGTPHIAGYSYDGKANATRMSLEHVAHWLALQSDELADNVSRVWPTIHIVPPSVPASLVPSNDAAERALQLYDPRQDSNRLKAAPEGFEQQRGNYPLRREQFD